MSEEKEKYNIEGILAEKKDRLLQILEIARKQTGYLKDDDVETLVEAIEHRQKLIDEIGELDKYIDENGLKNSAAYGAPGAQAILADIKSILQDIASEDKINIKAAEDKVEHFKGQIRGVKQNKNRITSYQNAPVSQDGIYIDKKK